MHSVAVVVLAHRSPVQVARLVRALAPLRCYVHIDRNAAPDVHEGVRALVGPHAELLRPRPTPWGSLGIVRANLDGIAAARRDGADTVVLLSGQSYPVVPNDDLTAFLAEHAGTTFMERHALPRPDWPRPTVGWSATTPPECGCWAATSSSGTADAPGGCPCAGSASRRCGRIRAVRPPC